MRCLPPENKPLPVEFTHCRPFLQAELAVMPNLRVIVALGKGAHDQVLRALTVRITVSLLLFALLMLAWHFGLISPHPLQSGGAPH